MIPIKTETSEFPSDLTALIKPGVYTNQKQQEQALKDALVQKKTRDAFLLWADHHRAFVEKSPTMNRIVEVISEISLDEQERHDSTIMQIRPFASLIHSLAKTISRQFTNSPCHSLESKGIETYEQLIEVIDLIPDYLSSGIITIKDIRVILSSTNRAGQTPLHNIHEFKKLLPLLKALLPSDRKALLSVWDSKGFIPLESPDIFYLALPWLNQLPPDELTSILSARDKKGMTPLHYPGPFAALIPLLNKLTTAQRVTLLSILDHKGRAPLQNRDILQLAIPWMKSMPTSERVPLLAIQYFPSGATLLYFEGTAETLIECLKELPSDERNKVIGVKNKLGISPLCLEGFIKVAIPWFKQLPSEEFVSILSIAFQRGKTYLHDNQASAGVEEMLDLFERLSDEQLRYLFSLRDELGNTPLHNEDMLDLVGPLLQKRGIDYSQWANKAGLTPQHMQAFRLSESWMTAPKVAADEGALLSKEDYDKQVAQLHDQLNKLWNGLKFGKERSSVNPLLLEINGVIREPEEVSRTLNEMVQLMREETAWVGTPNEKNTQAIHRFYCTMLYNFQTLVDKLIENNNPTETAGYLTSIAAVRFEKRCAAAYQSETRQKKRAILGLPMDLDSLVKEAAANALLAIIERIVRIDFNNDSHYMNQFQYAAGLAAEPDALSKITVLDAQNMILEEWGLSEIFQGFSEQLTPELSIDWLKSKTPEDYGQPYLDMQKELEVLEEALVKDTEKQLRSYLTEQQIKGTLAFFRSNAQIPIPQGYAGKKRELLHKFSEKQITVTDQGKVVELSDLDRQTTKSQLKPMKFEGLVTSIKRYNSAELQKVEVELKEQFLQYREQIKATYPGAPWIPMAFHQLRAKETEILAQLKGIVEFESFANRQKLNKAKRQYVLQVRQQFKASLDAIARKIEKSDLDISYSSKMSAWPSQACNAARCLKYNEKYLDSRPDYLLRMLQLLNVTKSQ